MHLFSLFPLLQHPELCSVQHDNHDSNDNTTVAVRSTQVRKIYSRCQGSARRWSRSITPAHVSPQKQNTPESNPEQPIATVAKPIGTASNGPGLLREVIGLPKPLLTAKKGARRPIPCAHFKWSRRARLRMQYCQIARASWAWAGGGLFVRNRNECCCVFFVCFGSSGATVPRTSRVSPLLHTVPASQSTYVHQARICAHVSAIHTHPRLRTGKHMHVLLLYSST